ncbi:MAG: PocR ligand-binding domain-containing protein [Romboutsia sp.]|uniref:PocR ligand-binding domain-containing protein n=1 Tax=Romboutsia sp. TaxID=1965302 RepID=UPI003F2FB306
MERFFEIEDLIEIEVLQNIQDNFAKSTGMGAVIVDYKGDLITKESNFTKFCNVIRNNESFSRRCHKCDAYGGVQSAITGKPYIYKCHAGLVDFAIPIMAEGIYIGAILGGQVRLEDENLNPKGVMASSKWEANEYLLKHYKDIKVKTYEEIESAASLMYHISNYVIEKSIINMTKEKTNHPKEINQKNTNKEDILNIEDKKILIRYSNKKIYSLEIEKAIKYIENNVKKSITLEDVAKHINLSPNYFSKLFKKEINENFITYLTNRRIEIAKEMLLEKNIPIINIAVDLSYNQPNYFSKVFKKSVGVTPSEYREKYLINTNVQ